MGQDEENTIRVLSAHRAVIDGIITFHGGRIVSTAGDSVLAEFSSVVEAVRCAVDIQEALTTGADALPANSRLGFRVGVNLGDVVVENDDLLGDGVNVAARLETLAEPGGICISSSVYDQITGKLDLGFQDIGEQALKNISRPIRVYRVSGTAAPQRSASALPAQRQGKSLIWGIGAAVVAAIATIAAWQTGWLRFGAADRASPINAAAPVGAPATGAPALSSATPGTASGAPPVQADVDTQRLRADAEALKKQAEADAARIRSEAAAAAARTQSDAEVATRTAETRTAKAAAASAAMDKTARAPTIAAADGARYDGTWNVTVVCPPAEGASAYKLEL